MELSSLIIAVDGPSGAGKSSVSKLIARRLGFTYIDTGAMYRTIALKSKEQGVLPDDAKKLAEISENSKIIFKRVGESNHTFLDGRDVSDKIREPEISLLSSKVSSVSSVRRALVAVQQKMGEKGGVIMDGRDIGTVVFPRADFKFFLDASLEVRGKRRHLELGPEDGLDLGATIEDMSRRDSDDSKRADSPLKMADDALYIDTTNLVQMEVVEKMEAVILGKIEMKKGMN